MPHSDHSVESETIEPDTGSFIPEGSDAQVALVYDKFLVNGGGERVFDIIAATFPDAPIYALSAHPKRSWEERYSRSIRTPPFAWMFRSRRMVIVLYPLACILMSLLKVRAKTVIVYSSTCGKFIGISAHKSILYSNYPNRGVFELSKVVSSPVIRFIASPFVLLFRALEVRQFRKYTQIASISEVSRTALLRYTGIESVVLPCPYNDAPFRSYDQTECQTRRNSFLIVSRLEPEKELEYAIRAFRDSPYELLVAGSGSLFTSLNRTYAAPNIKFLGFLSDVELVSAIRRCEAVIFPSEIEYSLVSIEANALGKAVIALDCAAARELLIDWNEDQENGTAIFYKQKTATSLLDAALAAIAVRWNIAVLHRNAARFAPKTFQQSLQRLAQ